MSAFGIWLYKRSSVAVLFAGLSASVFGGPNVAVGDTLDISKFKMTFDDRFDRLDISAHGPGTTWTAHTPWHGDFGDARFEDPGPNGPFSLTKEGLRITARQTPDGRWHSGLICSVDKDGAGQRGFTQMFGYFEMKAKLPAGPGVWPAFWLIGVDKRKASSEIDVLEFYGAFPGAYHNWLHLFESGRDTLSQGDIVRTTPGSLSDRYNTFGVLIEPDVTRFYLNRIEVWHAATPPEYHQPMYILANLALGGGWPIKITSAAVLDIAYVRVFQANERLAAKGANAGQQ